MSGFVHLHCHTTWSLLDGAIPAESLPHAAAALGFEAVAMTDHDSLLGAVRFSQACRAVGIKPLFGAELTVRPTARGHPRRSLRQSSPAAEANASDAACGTRSAAGCPSSPAADLEHITVIARDKTGYANLCRLISEAHLANERGSPATTFEAVAARSEGLFVLSGCARSEVAKLAAAGAMPEAVAAARRWRTALGEGYRVEVFDNRGYGHRVLRDRLLAVAKEAGVRPVATNDVHYATPLDAGTHEVLHAIKEIVPLSATHTLRTTSEHYLKDAAEMRTLFHDVPEAADETLAMAEACDFDLDLGNFHFPDVPVPTGETPTSHLAGRCYAGATRRYGTISKDVEDRLQRELSLIGRMGFASYFLVVADIVDHVRMMEIRCACRGSAAASLVCYVLGISDVDPIAYDLLFERFMNERRSELPDIDIDVESARREEVLEHILATYGAEQTAMCCMVDTFRARMAIREVGKALGLPPEEIDLVAKAFPRVRAKDIPAAIERLPELAGSNLRAGQLEQLFELCLQIDGFPRHLAVHPSGVVLSSPDLADRVPMQESFGGFVMLQADKDDVEELGLVKLDVLGVRMLSAIAHAADEIERVHQEKVDLDAVRRDDETTFRLIRSSRTLGCFQIESPGQRELLARFQPHRFEDLIVDISLFRPGPVKSDMVSPYLERRHGFEEITHPHPSLRPILAETHGVIVYHEQVIRVIAAVTGCSLADADFVRRHLDGGSGGVGGLGLPSPRGPSPDHLGAAGRIERRPEDEEEADDDVASWFKTSAVANGFTPEQAEVLWKEVFAFASFGFCKSHAAAFALPTYLSAWLKAHYPAEFLAGVLTHEPGMYPRRLIVADARQMGIPILPIDANASDAVYRVEPVPNEDEARTGTPPPSEFRSRGPERGSGPQRGLSERTAWVPARSGVLGIRLALSEVRDISEAEVNSILEARSECPFSSLEDLWRRTDLSRPVLENLVHVGALDSFETRGRRELMWKVVELCSQVKLGPGRQLSFRLDNPIQQELPGLPPYTALEETEAELAISGIDARRHVMDLYRALLAEVGCVPAENLRERRNDTEVWVAGVKVASQTPAIRSGQRIIFVTLDDLTGPIDVTVFERVQPRCARTIFHSWLLVVRGVVRKRGGASLTYETDSTNIGITVVAREVFDITELAADRKAGHSLAAALGRQRKRQVASGLAPGGADHAPGRLWHASGGSAGR